MRTPLDWLPKVILGTTIVVVAMALAGLFIGNGYLRSQGVEQVQAQLDS
jgi:hypothetical protein